MKTWAWLLILVVAVVIAFALGRYWSTIKTAYTNRDKISAGIDLASNLGTILG